MEIIFDIFAACKAFFREVARIPKVSTQKAFTLYFYKPDFHKQRRMARPKPEIEIAASI
jgi:hypothetical protein